MNFILNLILVLIIKKKMIAILITYNSFFFFFIQNITDSSFCTSEFILVSNVNTSVRKLTKTNCIRIVYKVPTLFLFEHRSLLPESQRTANTLIVRYLATLFLFPLQKYSAGGN